MINADRALSDLHERNERNLKVIFGGEYDALNDEAKKAAERVLMWVEGVSGRYDEAAAAIRKRNIVIKAIKETVSDYAGGELFYSVMHNVSTRQAADLRAMMYRMVYELTTVPKSQIAKILGTGQDHSTVHIALRRADDLRLIDRTFRDTYDMLLERVRAKIDETR